MNNQIKDWQTDLHNWLQHNKKTLPRDQRLLREAFVQHFPIDSLQDMTLDQYAYGKPDSFCYWLASKTADLGRIGHYSNMFGVWWNKEEKRWRWDGDKNKNENKPFQDAEDALAQIKQGLLALIDATRNQQFDDLDKIGSKLLGNKFSLRIKPLYLYFPENFLSISNPKHLQYFASCFRRHLHGDTTAMNLQLLAYLRSLPEFDGFEPPQMAAFLYDTYPPKI